MRIFVCDAQIRALRLLITSLCTREYQRVPASNIESKKCAQNVNINCAMCIRPIYENFWITKRRMVLLKPHFVL